MCFVGDADGTVDPVLAWGIIMGMEDVEAVARCMIGAVAAASPGGPRFDAELQDRLLGWHRGKTQ